MSIDHRLIFGLILGVEFAIIQYAGERRDRRAVADNRFRPLDSPLILLLMCPMMLILSFIPRLSASAVLYRTALALLQAGMYCTLLLSLHPILCRTVSGKGRAVLWLLPNILYVMAYQEVEPRFILRADRRWFHVLLLLWAAGAAAVLAWKITEHLRFRKALLRDAYAPPEQAVTILRDEEQKLKTKRKYPLLISPAVKTPLSVGVFERAIRILLPARDYDEEALALILRHELVHIRRQDSATKLFLTVCTALSWFNPFVWLSLRRSREDFESGCDEIVLTNADDDTRRRYAELLLDTAADARGFTTCLSADARSLRARLKSVVEPKRRAKGSLLSGLMVFLLIVTSGQLTLAYDMRSGGELLFRDHPSAAISYTWIWYSDGDGQTEYPNGPHEALTEYLADLPLYRVSADYYDLSEPALHMYCVTPEGWYFLRIGSRALRIENTDIPTETRTYYIDGGIDLDYLTGILEQKASP